MKPTDLGTEVPTAYTEGFSRALAIDPVRARNYVAHTTIGDPLADEMVHDLEELGQEASIRIIQTGLHGGDRSIIDNAPASTRAFLDSIREEPEWVDKSKFPAGIRLFHRNTRLILAGFVGGVLVEGFSTNIAKSFFLTGRIRDRGVRRLKQNNRHMLEIFMPGGLERGNDGWAHSVRLRLIHARVRKLISQSEEWDEELDGIAVSSAHLGLAISVFSARLLQYLDKLNARFDDEEREGFMHVWRYAGHVMGLPDSILFKDEADAKEIFRIAKICEPEPSFESKVLAANLIQSAPIVAGITDEKKRKEKAQFVMDISRSMIGDELADKLGYPDYKSRHAMLKFRISEKIFQFFTRYAPNAFKENINFITILDASVYDQMGINYHLPDHVYSEYSSKW